MYYCVGGIQVCTTVNLDEHFVLGSSQNSNFRKACFLKHCLFEMREVIVPRKNSIPSKT